MHQKHEAHKAMPVLPPVRMTEEPLFRSASDALRFAYLFSGEQYPLTIMAKMMRGICGSGKGLVGIDGAAQAGLILRMVKDLSSQHQAALGARYLERSDRRWADSVLALTQDSLTAVSGVLSHRYVRQAIVMRFFGAKVNFGEVAEKCGVHRNTVSNHNRLIGKHLRELEDAAYWRATDLMRERGVIE